MPVDTIVPGAATTSLVQTQASLTIQAEIIIILEVLPVTVIALEAIIISWALLLVAVIPLVLVITSLVQVLVDATQLEQVTIFLVTMQVAIMSPGVTTTSLATVPAIRIGEETLIISWAFSQAITTLQDSIIIFLVTLQVILTQAAIVTML